MDLCFPELDLVETCQNFPNSQLQKPYDSLSTAKLEENIGYMRRNLT